MRILLACAFIALSVYGCGSGSSSGTAPTSAVPPPSTNANLSSLALTEFDLVSIDLAQIFQASQTDYTAGIRFLVGRVRLSAMSEDPNATVLAGCGIRAE